MKSPASPSPAPPHSSVQLFPVSLLATLDIKGDAKMPLHRNGRYKKLTGPAPFWGTLQNPEAHANSMSRAEAEAFVQRSHPETQAAILQHDADQLAAQKAAAERAAEERQLENDRRLIRELEDLRALALAAPPPVLAPEMSGEQVPMFSQAELDAANFVPVPHEYPTYGQVVVAPADDLAVGRVFAGDGNEVGGVELGLGEHRDLLAGHFGCEDGGRSGEGEGTEFFEFADEAAIVFELEFFGGA